MFLLILLLISCVYKNAAKHHKSLDGHVIFHQTPQSVENSISCHVIAISTALNVNLLRSMLGIIAVIHVG